MENRLHKIACRIQKEGVVRREYGHAYVADDMEKGLDLRPRLEAKEAIGREIAKRLEDFHTVLLDCSSTVHKAAAPLNRMSSRDIFTNSLVLAERLDAQRHCVFVLPGRKRSKNESLIGPWTEEYIVRIHVDVCVLGSSGVLHAQGPTCHSYTEISTKRKMMEAADFVIVALDAGKFQESGLHTYASWDEVDAVITDRMLDRKTYAFLMEKMEVWVAQDEVSG